MTDPNRPRTRSQSRLGEGPEEILQVAPTPPVEDPMELLRNLQRLLRSDAAAQKEPTRRTPTFSGYDDEDPRLFLRNIEQHFAGKVHPDDYVVTAAEQLQHAAAKWYSTIHYRMDWEEFKTLLTQKFDDTEVLAELHIKLYSEKQRTHETAIDFLKRKELLARRLGLANELILATVFRKLMKPEIVHALPLPMPVSLEELKSTAVAIENRLGEQGKLQLRPKSEPARKPASNPPTKTQDNQADENVPKCWHCPGRHWNRDCPVRQQKIPKPEN